MYYIQRIGFFGKIFAAELFIGARKRFFISVEAGLGEK
jgi:hypothetical protein